MISVATFDLETWDLSPEFGPVLVASVHSSVTDEITSFRQDEFVKEGIAEDMVDDVALLTVLRDLLEAHHVICGWHIKGFDIPLLNTRLVKAGERRLKPMLCYDPMWQYKGWRGLKPKSASLASAASFYGLDEQKFGVSAEEWMKARAGNKKAMDVAVERCESDVRITAAIALRTLDEGLVRRLERWP